ncbi:MAG TPA: hypothetical protein VFT23_18990 [Burkholderiales bacterium]|nr:hypothetical protein [Burkholderiales bacterium]
MSERWTWVVRYGVVIILALILAAVLGEMELFKTTRLGKTFNAARVAQFLGYGGALLVFWLLAQRAAATIPVQDERWKLVRSILVPLATLIVVACAHSVLLLVLGPVMNKAWLLAYNWTFIAAIILSAAWLVGALFTGSASLAPLFGAENKASRQARSQHSA